MYKVGKYGEVYDKPYGWKKQEIWRQKAYDMWKRIWSRVSTNSSYNCNIYSRFKFFSDFLNWLESEPRFEEFCSTCHKIRWCISIKKDDNSHYYPQYITLCTQSEVCTLRNHKHGTPTAPKSVIGISLDGTKTLIFNKVSDVADKGFDVNDVIDVCKKRRDTYKDYRWFYINLTEL